MTSALADPATDIVIGHARTTGDPNGTRAFGRGADAVTYLSAAVRRHPYRGNGHNLVYRRELFFHHKGFSRSLNLHDGDDDIFINEVASGRNTAVSLSADAIISATVTDPAKSYRQECVRRAFTARFLRKGSRRFFGLSSAMMWLWTGLAASACAISCPDMTRLCSHSRRDLLLWIPVTITWRRALKTVEATAPSAVTIPLRRCGGRYATSGYRMAARQAPRPTTIPDQIIQCRRSAIHSPPSHMIRGPYTAWIYGRRYFFLQSHARFPKYRDLI